MKKHKIAVIAGDGIGPEVLAEGVRVLKQVAECDGGFSFEFTFFPWGCEYYLKTGKMMDEDGIEKLKQYDAIFLGAVGYPGVPDHISLWDLLLNIRKSFDQYVNLRPVRLLEGAPCPLKDVDRKDVDMIFVRENSEGEYAGSGSWLFKGKPHEVVLQEGVFSRHGCERIIRYAYDLAREKGKTLTSISKGNALNYSMVFWDQIFKEVGEDYPDVKTFSYLVDAASMFMVKDPARFEIVVTSNLFGDILTDEASMITGSIGMLPSASLGSTKLGMYEPIHGSAPDIAGTGKANPIAMILSCAMMLRYSFDLEEEAQAIETAVKAVLKGGARTADIAAGGKSISTREMSDLILAELK